MIHEKLLKFKALNIKVEKDVANPFFKSSYTSLNEVLNKVEKPLNDLKVIILQLPEEKGLRTILLDTEDNSKVEGFLPFVEVSTAQKLGSNLTYNRRYSLITMLGLEEEDDDGNAASQPKPVAKTLAKPIAKPVVKDDGLPF
jgi:hypothetical protein